ncbi:MAG: hypothetical protein J5490_05915 [Bacteroidales bacterium]|nr:hypothetical protein [Bacteroidales bacterium]
MNRKNNSTWTDEIRSAFENAELTPSEGAWERLQADLGRRRGAAWLPYAGLAAALAAVVLGVFLFSRKGSQPTVTTVESPQVSVVAQAPEADAAPAPEQVPQQEAAAPQEPAPVRRQAIAKADAPVRPDAIVIEETPVKEEVPVKEDISVKEEAPAKEVAQVQKEVPQTHPVTLERKAERRKVRISLAGGGLGGNQGGVPTPMVNYPATSLMTKSDGEYLSDGPKRVMDISELIEHQVPVKLGVNLDIPVGKRMYIGSGVEYFYLRSSVAGEKQILHWLGIPLNFKYSLVQNRAWTAGIGAGATAETCLNASLLGREYKEDMQFSAKLFADLRFPITRVLSLYACPELSYYFTQTNLPIYRSGKPVAFGVTAGLAINL